MYAYASYRYSYGTVLYPLQIYNTLQYSTVHQWMMRLPTSTYCNLYVHLPVMQMRLPTVQYGPDGTVLYCTVG